MAKYEDYIKASPVDGIDEEILDAAGQQEARQDDATPKVDWEQRYSELEKLNSRQAQTLGDYRKTIDDFIASPTPTEPLVVEKVQPLTVDDFYDNPNEAVQRAVESHPAIQEARALKQRFEQESRKSELEEFATKHEDYQQVGATPEFQNWVADNPTRLNLYQRADVYDFSAADALFSLYKAEKGMKQVQNQADITQAELVSSSGEMVKEPPKYSRAEYINQLKRSKQGDLDAETWVKNNAAGYRRALETGNVRD